jgi:hypothetical protein
VALTNGEGCLKIYKDKNKYIYPHVNISNTNIDLIHYVQMLTYIGYVDCTISDLDRKNVYKWNLYVHQIRDFLIKIRPYLKVKNQQCNLLLEYFQLKGDRRINELTYKEKITLELIYDEIKVFNKRGE